MMTTADLLAEIDEDIRTPCPKKENESMMTSFPPLNDLRSCKLTLLACCLMFPLSGIAQTTSSACHAPNAEGVVPALSNFFVASEQDNQSLLETTLTRDFFAFEEGRKLTEADVKSFLDSAKLTGQTLKWSLSEMSVHQDCDLAWVTYVDKGSMTGSKGRIERTWLESAILRYEDGRWRVAFLHSTRVAE